MSISFSHVYHLTKFGRNWFICLNPSQYHIKYILGRIHSTEYGSWCQWWIFNWNSKTTSCKDWTENGWFWFDNPNINFFLGGVGGVCVCVDRGWRANCHFLQTISRQSTVSYAHLSSPIYMVSVAWCGVGRQELMAEHKPTFTSADAINKSFFFPSITKFSKQKWNPDVQIQILRHDIRFLVDQRKTVWENELNCFCFLLTLWPSAKTRVTECGYKENGRGQRCLQIWQEWKICVGK